MEVSDDEVNVPTSNDEQTQATRKVVVVNPFFAERHLGPRANHPDGTTDMKAQLTSLWVLGDPTRPRREPRELDDPGFVFPKQKDDAWCACLPTKCGPCHPSGRSDYGTVSTWGDDSDSYAHTGLCAPITDECVPFGKSRRTGWDWSDDDSVDPISAGILKQQRDTRRPGLEPNAPHEPPLTGCFGTCIEDEQWSEDEKGRRRRRRKKGCLAGPIGDEDPLTGRRKPTGCLGQCLGAMIDCIDGSVDDETGRRVGGCLGCLMGNEKPIGSGKRRGGVCGNGCLFGFVDYDSDGIERRQGGCLTDCLYGAEDSGDDSVPRRRAGGCMGCLLGDVDSETNAKKGGCLGCLLGDEDPDARGERVQNKGGCLGCAVSDEDLKKPGERKHQGCLAGCLLGDLHEDEDGNLRRNGGCANCFLGAEDCDTNARRGGCLSSCLGDEDPETGRRKGGCLSSCLFGDISNYEYDSDGNRGRRIHSNQQTGCLAGCDEDSDWGTGSSDDGMDGKKIKPNRSCLAECLRALCGSSEQARRRRRRRRRRREALRLEQAKNEGSDSNSQDVPSDVYEINFGDDSNWAEHAILEKKPPGYLDVREKVLATHKAPPRIVVDFHRPSSVLFSLMSAFFAPALWKVLNRLERMDCIPCVGSKQRWSKDKEKEGKTVEALTNQTLPYLPPVEHEILGAALGVLFMHHALRLSRISLKRRKQLNIQCKNGPELFWLSGLFPQFAKAARSDRNRLNSRRRAVIRMRWRAELVKRAQEDKETWDDVVPAANVEEPVEVKEDEPPKESWKWPEIKLPELPNLSLPDVSVEWRQQTHPSNDSTVEYDPSIEKALRANVKRHYRKNKGQKLFWGETKQPEEPEQSNGDEPSDEKQKYIKQKDTNTFGVAKKVDDVAANDDTDKAIGLGLSKMRRK